MLGKKKLPPEEEIKRDFTGLVLGLLAGLHKGALCRASFGVEQWAKLLLPVKGTRLCVSSHGVGNIQVLPGPVLHLAFEPIGYPLKIIFSNIYYCLCVLSTYHVILLFQPCEVRTTMFSMSISQIGNLKLK